MKKNEIEILKKLKENEIIIGMPSMYGHYGDFVFRPLKGQTEILVKKLSAKRTQDNGFVNEFHLNFYGSRFDFTHPKFLPITWFGIYLTDQAEVKFRADKILVPNINDLLKFLIWDILFKKNCVFKLEHAYNGNYPVLDFIARLKDLGLENLVEQVASMDPNLTLPDFVLEYGIMTPFRCEVPTALNEIYRKEILEKELGVKENEYLFSSVMHSKLMKYLDTHAVVLNKNGKEEIVTNRLVLKEITSHILGQSVVDHINTTRLLKMGLLLYEILAMENYPSITCVNVKHSVIIDKGKIFRTAETITTRTNDDEDERHVSESLCFELKLYGDKYFEELACLNPYRLVRFLMEGLLWDVRS